MNVDMSCDQQCLSCERFFDCDNPVKEKVYDRSRMARVRDRMANIKHKIAVIAGKGGVGKSLCAANIAAELAIRGRKVALLDNDYDGPCIPKMFGVRDKKLVLTKGGIKPVEGHLGVKIISMGLITPEEESLTWFHELRRNATEEFFGHVIFGDLDYLILDLPPGTSSDAINMMLYLPDLDGVVAVTMPIKVSQIVVKKAILLTQKAKFRVLGVIENMSGFACPKCGDEFDILLGGGGEMLAQETDVPFLGKIPIDPVISQTSDEGKPFVITHPDSVPAKAMKRIVDQLEEAVGWVPN
jgi:ATP-binding protein involved in chromosome partitioning